MPGDGEGNVIVDSREMDIPTDGSLVLWSEALAPHTLENVGDGAIHAFVVELKEPVSGRASSRSWIAVVESARDTGGGRRMVATLDSITFGAIAAQSRWAATALPLAVGPVSFLLASALHVMWAQRTIGRVEQTLQPRLYSTAAALSM